MVEVADNRTLIVTDVHRGCTLEISGEKFPIDLILIDMREFCVIVGMDWMDSYDAEIMLVQGDLPRRTVALCSAARGRQYLQHNGT